MPHPNAVRVQSRRIFSGRVVTLDVDTIRVPPAHELELEIVRHPGAAAVVPLLSEPDASEPSILLLRQYRYAANGVLWEIPAGKLEQGEEPAACAARELREETGARAERIEHLTTIFTTPGFTDEVIHLFLATGISAGEPEHQVDEFIEMEGRSLPRVLEMIRDGDIRDAKSIVALLYVAGFRLGL